MRTPQDTNHQPPIAECLQSLSDLDVTLRVTQASTDRKTSAMTSSDAISVNTDTRQLQQATDGAMRSSNQD
jgi:hypothetical protein